MMNKTVKRIGVGIGLVLLGVVIYLCYPGNYYLRKALVHQLPRIDQYPIFENRIVQAGSPAPWKVADTYNEAIIPEHLQSLFDELGTIAFVVIKDTALLFEQYWDNYSPTSHSNSFSMAKSIVALAIGCAIDEGKIKSVDQPLSDFYPAFSSYNNTSLTIRHLLTMSAGTDFQEAYTSPFSPTTQLYYGNNLEKVTMGMKLIEEPGVYFEYQSGVTQLLAHVLEKATGERLSNYISRKFWTPMQAEENALWSLDKKDGMEKAYCCFNSNARDFARFGQLLLNQGSWNGRQLVSSSFLTEAVTPDTALFDREINRPNEWYGYQFWKLDYKGFPVYYMRGILGQYVFAIPHKSAVVVRLGHKRSDLRNADNLPADIEIWLEAAMSIL